MIIEETIEGCKWHDQKLSRSKVRPLLITKQLILMNSNAFGGVFMVKWLKRWAAES